VNIKEKNEKGKVYFPWDGLGGCAKLIMKEPTEHDVKRLGDQKERQTENLYD